jgi:hypothetical protein
MSKHTILQLLYPTIRCHQVSSSIIASHYSFGEAIWFEKAVKTNIHLETESRERKADCFVPGENAGARNDNRRR